MKLKLIFLTIAALCFFSGCIRPTDCTRGNLTPDQLYIVSYPNHPVGQPTSRRDLIRTANQNGEISFPPDVNTGCNNIGVSAVLGRFAVSPSYINLQALPPSFTVTGDSMSTTYGMPFIKFQDDDGTTFGVANASSVAGDGTWMTVNTPDLSRAYTGRYIVLVYNREWDGSARLIGGCYVETVGREHPACDPDGAKESYCYKHHGEWDSSNCSCFIDPCMAPTSRGIKNCP